MVAGATLLLSACADGEAAERISEDLDVIDAAADAGTAVVVADGGVVDQVNVLACDTDRRTLEMAIEAFTAMEGRAPVDETELVGNYIREASTTFDVSPDGVPVPAPGSPCV